MVSPAKPALDRAAVLVALASVADPEIPVVSVVDLGIVQSVTIDGDHVIVAITPTFSGCPALDMMRDEIGQAVRAAGAATVDVPIVLDPPWTSDRIAPDARERMRAIGLMPPPPASGRFQADPALSIDRAATLAHAAEEAVSCPFCGSDDTVVENPFGPTICRALHYCNACQQPFEAFKSL